MSKHLIKIRITSALLTGVMMCGVITTAVRAGLLSVTRENSLQVNAIKERLNDDRKLYNTVFGNIYDRYDTTIMENSKLVIDSDNEYHDAYTYMLGNAAYDIGLLSSEYDTLTDKSYTQNGKGLNIRLTIDDQLQKLCYELVKDRRKSIAILSKHSGEVLALAGSYEEPFTLSGKVTPEQLESYSSAYEPVWLPEYLNEYHTGSVMKIYTSAVACDTGLAGFTVEDTGVAFFNGKAIYNAYETRTKTENMTSAFINSSNVYFSTLAVRLGADTLKEYIGRFRMNCDIQTDFGTIRNSSGLKKRTHDYDIASFGYGQGGYYSTVSMAMMAQAALTGRQYRPHIIESAFYYDENGEEFTVRETEEEIISDNIISPEACRSVEYLMKAAANDGGFPDSSGVKTGTAQIVFDGRSANRATMIATCCDKFIIAISEISGEGEELYGSSHSSTIKQIIGVLEQY